MAALTSLQILALEAPEVYALATVADWITSATELVPSAPWGTMRARGIAYLAAHMAWETSPTLRGTANTADSIRVLGGIASKSAGDLSESYSGGAGSLGSTATLGDLTLDSTVYGRKFVGLQNKLDARTPFVVRL